MPWPFLPTLRVYSIWARFTPRLAPWAIFFAPLRGSGRELYLLRFRFMPRAIFFCASRLIRSNRHAFPARQWNGSPEQSLYVRGNHEAGRVPAADAGAENIL